MASTARLYLVEIDIGYCGTSFEDFCKILLEDVNFYLAEEKAGSVKHLYKAVGERKVFIVIEKSAEGLDEMLLTSPILRKLGNKATTKVTEMITYEAFANCLNKLHESETRYDITGPNTKKEDGFYYWIEFNVEYHGHTQADLIKIWCEEATAAIGAKGAGLLVDLWKAVGMRRIHCLAKFDSPDQLDDVLSFGLPIVKGNGDNMHLKVNAVRGFDTLAEHLTTITA